MSTRQLFSAIALLLICAASAIAGTPSQITVQGRLTDAANNPLPAGAKTFTFRLFNASVGGSQIWPGGGGEVQSITSGGDGLWIGLLGAVDPLNDAAFADSVRWLEINVDGTTLPRIRLVTGPYAYRVATVDGASGGTITSKVSIGPGHTNSGAHAFVAGTDNQVAGNYSAVGGGTLNNATGESSVISGGQQHDATGFASTVGGGANNTASSSHSTVGGGLTNAASGIKSVVAGGAYNEASGENATIGGGTQNVAAWTGSVIAGGSNNSITSATSAIGGGAGNFIEGDNSVVAGGSMNSNHGTATVIGGGASNLLEGFAGVIGGGTNNELTGNHAVIDGGHHNLTSTDGAVIGGGGYNRAQGSYATVAGGGGINPNDSNSASGQWSTVGGGLSNTAAGIRSSVDGGSLNLAVGDGAVVGGGSQNRARGPYSVIGGGGGNTDADSNVARGSHSTIAGGRANIASGDSTVVAGGSNNRATALYAVVGGGVQNSAAGGGATVAGGGGNSAGGGSAAVGGGGGNRALQDFSVVAGGRLNTASGYISTVGGGDVNTAGSHYATVPGGFENVASGSFSFAAGSRAHALHVGTFVWAGGSIQKPIFSSTGDFQFLINASGGVGIGTNAPQQQLSLEAGMNIDQANANDGTLLNSLHFGSASGEAISSRRIPGTNQYGLDFYTNSIQRMTITNGGYVGVGTLTPAYRVDLPNEANANGQGRANAWVTYSSRRWKENIAPIRDALAKVERLRGVEYDNKSDGSHSIGLIAEEVGEVMPEVVQYESNGIDAASLDYARLVSLLIEGMKEQQRQIDELKAALKSATP